MGKGVKVALVVLVLILSIFQALFFMYEASSERNAMQAKIAVGTITMCINSPPILGSLCRNNLNQSTTLENNTYFCQINATKSGNANISLNYTYMSFMISGLDFAMNSSGFLTIWANHTGIGTYLIPITIKDNSSCPVPLTYNYMFTIQDINDPPVLIRLLPSKDINEGDTIVPFFLKDYFADIDGDSMTYTFTNSSFIILIDPNTSRVTITAPTGFCSSADIYFIATDEHNLFVESNVVTLEEKCEDQPGNEGGGGGGDRQECEPLWECRDWSKCFVNGTRFRTCVDLNACDLNNLKQDFWEKCIYVPTCYDGVQNQEETDIDCGGPCIACKAKKIPPPPVNATCEDGIKNQEELGIDCGGPCPVCKDIEVPGLIPEDENKNLLAAVMMILLTSGILALVYAIFRKEIKSLFAKIAWWMTRRRQKQIIITDLQKEDLLADLKVLESRLKKSGASQKEIDNAFQEILKLNRKYLGFALKTTSFYEDEPNKSLRKIPNPDLRRSLKLFIRRQIVLETSKNLVIIDMVQYYIHELRHLIINTSNSVRGDHSFDATELSVMGTSLNKCRELLYNATIALEFSNIEVAKQYYFDLLKMYELLTDREKEIMFYEISKLFSYVKYVLSWAKKD